MERHARLADVIRRYYGAYEAKERGAIERLLGDDFTFSSPQDDRIGRAAYFERCWPNSENIRRFHIAKLFVEGEEAFVLYELEPKSGTRFRNTEFFRFADGKISAVEVYFGSYKGS